MLAATRGDGKEGEDVTHNALTGAIRGLPLRLDLEAAARSLAGGGGAGKSGRGARSRARSAADAEPAAAVGKAAEQLPRDLEVRGEVYMTKDDFAEVGDG